MRRYGRRYEVVPIVERLVENDLFGEPVVERLAHFPAGFIRFFDDFSQYFQPLFRHGVRGASASVGHGEERRSAPGAGYVGEEAVLDGVELGAVRGVVHDKDSHSDAVGEIHEVLLDDSVSAGVGAAPVAEDDEHRRVRVEALQVSVPYPLDVVADEAGGVVAGANREVARVVCQVVDAVWHNHAVGESLEVVVESLGRGRAVHLAVPLEVADHLLLLGVHADDGDSRLEAGPLSRVNLHELGIPVLRLAQRQALDERPAPEPRSGKHLPDDIVGHVVPALKEQSSYLRYGEV